MRKIARWPGYAGALVLAGAAVLAVLAAPAAAQAAAAPALTVVPCSSSALAAAINQANTARFATLVLARRCTYELATAAAGDDGLPPVTGNLLILGSGGTTIRRSAAAAPFRILHVAAGGRLTLVNVTVAGGAVGGGLTGGGILDAGTLVLRHVRLTGNAGTAGDGQPAAGDLVIDRSTLSGNTGKSGDGGAIDVEPESTTRISNSKLVGNESGLGGAIISDGDLVIDRSTLSGNTANLARGGAIAVESESTTRISGTVVTRNSAATFGGGIFNHEGAMVLIGDRVTSNQAAVEGGGIDNSGGTVSLRFTLVAFNTPDNCFPQGAIAGCRN